MYARVARWEGSSSEELKAISDQINSSDGPPPGVPGKGIMMLVDEASGTSLAIALFETAEDLETGDAALNDMSPPGESQGRRVSVEKYEVTADRRL
jgi:hypothetical protein